MPIPAGVEKVTITDGGVPWTLPDGTVMQGYLTITGPGLDTVPEDDFLFGGYTRHQVVDGRFDSFQLVAVDATGMTVTGFSYKVDATVRNGADWTRYIQPYKAVPTVVLADLLTPDPATPGYSGAFPSSTVVTETSYGQAAFSGSALTYSRGDHTHGTPTALVPSSTVVSGTSFGQSSAVGSATTYAREDHTHGTPTAPVIPSASSTVTSETAYGQAASAGSASSYSRGDHTHGTPALLSIQVAAPTGNATIDLASVNAALTAQNSQPAELQLQAGIYVLPAPASPSSGCISIGVNGTVLRGRGIGVTTLRLAGGSSDVTGIIRTPSGVQNSRITFRDFSVDGNSAAQTGTPTIIGAFCGVTPNSTQTDTDIRFENIEVYGCTGYGFDPHERTTRAVFIGCLSHDNGTDGAHDGFTLDGCYDFTVVNCKAWSNGRHGFNFVTASTRGTVSDCESWNNGGNGVTLQNGAKYVEFTNVHAYSNTAANWVINGVPQTGQQDNTPGGLHTFTNCHATLAGTHGFQLVGVSNNRFVGCHAQDSSQASSGSSDHFRIGETGTTYSTGNTFIGCTWGQTSGVASVAKWGINEQTSNDGSNVYLGCSGSGTSSGSLNLLNSTSALLAAHNGSSGAHPFEFAYSFDTPARHGYKEWNFPTDLIGSSSGVSLVSGTIYGMRLDCQSGQTITTATLNVAATGSGLTSGQCVLVIWDCTTSTAQEITRTGDISGSFGATGAVDLALNASFTATPGLKVAGELLLVGSGMPSLLRTSSTSATGPNAGQTSASPRKYHTSGTGQTSVPSSLALSSTTATGALTLWLAFK